MSEYCVYNRYASTAGNQDMNRLCVHKYQVTSTMVWESVISVVLPSTRHARVKLKLLAVSCK